MVSPRLILCFPVGGIEHQAPKGWTYPQGSCWKRSPPAPRLSSSRRRSEMLLTLAWAFAMQLQLGAQVSNVRHVNENEQEIEGR